jgi:patatin-like phospholipase/acyl hydrolase
MTGAGAEPQSSSPTSEPCRILSLDGGGAKGFYSLGVLKEIEAMLDRPLCDCFHLIFGTSTGAIIAALLALGYRVDDVHALYKKHVPTIMRQRTRRARSAALSHLVKTVFEDRTFADVKTGIGIVATRWQLETPMIFKADVAQAQGRRATFLPGFGCAIAGAVQASCSAYPFFDRFVITTGRGERVELFDGGYCANNPTLYAIADAVIALQRRHSDLRVVSVGVGVYPEPSHWHPKRWMQGVVKRIWIVQLLQKTLNVNTFSMERLRSILFQDIWTVRINDTFERPEMATDLMESNPRKLNLLYQHGGESFAQHETELRRMLLAERN